MRTVPAFLLLLTLTCLCIVSCTSIPSPVYPVDPGVPPFDNAEPSCNDDPEKSYVHNPGVRGQKACTPIIAPKKRNPLMAGVLQIWGDKTKFWSPDEVIRVRFLDGTSAQKAEAWKRFKVVDDLCGVTFVNTSAMPLEPAEMRVSFHGSGHWSYVGTDCRLAPDPAPTMNLELTSRHDSSEWDRVAVHEVLHALGFDHEQQHPGFQIPWDEEKVIKYYADTQGWSEEETRQQVLSRSVPKKFFGSGYDRTSIMHYPVSAELTKGGYSVGWNEKMSHCDVQMLVKAYPQKVAQGLPDKPDSEAPNGRLFP